MAATIQPTSTQDCTSSAAGSVYNVQRAATNANPVDGSGTYSIVTGCNSSGNSKTGVTAYGAFAQGTDKGAVAVGFGATAGQYAVATGVESRAVLSKSIAIGAGANVGATNNDGKGIGGIAIGADTKVNADNGIAIGLGAQSNTSGVAIGSGSIASVDSGVLGYDSATGQNSNSVTSVWKSTNAAVAIGDGTNITRQITGVAAGQQDTDAVNVAQLKSTRTFATNNLKTVLGGNASVDNNGNIAISNIAGTGKSNLNDAIATVKQSADDQFAKLKTEGNQVTQGSNSNTSTATGNTLSDGTRTNTSTASGTTYGYADTSNQASTKIGQDGLSFKDSKGNSTGPSVTATGLDAGNLKVTNVQSGAIATNSKDAVNGGQVANISQSIANAIGGVQVNSDGTISSPSYNIAGSKQTSVSDALNALNQGFSVTSNSTSSQAVKAGDAIDIGTAEGEKNLTVSKSGNNIKYALNRNLDVDSVQAGSSRLTTDTLTVGQASPVVVDGSKGTITGLTNTTWTADSTQNRSAAASTGQVADVKQSADDQFAKLKTEGNQITQGNNSNTSTATGNTLSDGTRTNTSTASGTTYGYADTSNQASTKIGQDGLSFKDSNGNSTGPSVTATGINAGNTTVKNVAAGAVTSASTDAVNGSQLFTVSNSIKNILGGNANTDANGNLTMSNIAGTGKSNLNDAIATASAKAKTTVTSADDNINVSATTSTDGLGTTYTISGKTDQNLNSLKVGNTSITTTGVIVDDGINKSNSTASQTILSNANSANKNIAQADSNSLSDGSANRNIAKADSNSLSDNSGNINVSKANLTSLSDSSGNLNFLTATGNTVKKGSNSNTSTATGNTLSDGTRTNTSTASGTTYGYADTSNQASTKIGQDGLSFKDSKGNSAGPSVTATGLDAGNLKVTNVQSGAIATNSKDAVNGGQVANISQSVANAIGGVQVNQDGTISSPSYNIAGSKQTSVSDALNALNQGFSVTSNGTSSQAVKAGDAIDIGTAEGEKNLTVSKSGNNIKYALNRNLDVDSVQAGSSRLTTDTLTVGQANPVVVDGKQGTVTGLSNTTWTTDSAQNRSAAASTGQVADVKQSADDQFAKLKTEGNQITQGSNSNTSTATGNTLSDGTRTNTSTASGTTYGYADTSNQASTKIGQDGLSFKDSNGNSAGPSVTATGLDAGNLKVTNVQSGAIATNSKDAVNGGQVANISQSVANAIGGVQVNQDGTISSPSYNIAGSKQTSVSDALNALNQGFSVTSNGTSSQAVKAGDAIDIGTAEGEKNLTVSKSGNNIKYALNRNLDVDSVQAGSSRLTTDTLTVGQANPVVVDGSKGTITGLTNTTWTADSTQNRSAAASTGQVADVKQSADDQFAKLKTEGNQITQGNNINTSTATGNTLSDGTRTNTSTASGTTYGYADTSNQASTKIGQDGLSFKDSNGNSAGPSVTATGLDAGNLKVTNVQSGAIATNSKDAVNGGQVANISQSVANAIGGVQVNQDGTISSPSYNIAGSKQTSVSDALNALNQGFSVTSNGTSSQAVKAGDAIDIGTAEGEKNLTVSKSGNNIKYALNRNLDVDSVQAGSSRLTTDTLTVGQASPMVVDGSKGTITGLTNTTWTTDSAQNRSAAASTGQVADVQASLKEQLGTLGNNSVQYAINKDGSVDYDSILAGSGKGTAASIGQDSYGNSVVTGGGTTISNVANGKNASDAVNKGQLDALSTYISNNVTNVQDGANHNVSVTGQVVNQNYTSGKNSNQDSLFLTYDKEGQTTTDQLTIGETVQKMNKEGVKFTHTNSTDGKDSSAGATNSTALGVDAVINSGADNTIALGTSTSAAGTATNSVVIGNNSSVTGASSVAIGDNAVASGNQSISIGTGNQVNGSHSGAFGDPSIIDGTNSYSVGNSNNISTDNTFALGNGITQTMEGSVVLGNNSAARTGAGVSGYIPTSSATIDQFAINATKSTTGAIAVGDSQNNIYRQITGVAAGTADSDAVNVAQLKAVDNKVLALKTEGNTTSDSLGHSNASTATGNTLSDGTRTNTSTASGTTYGYADTSNQASTKIGQDGLSFKDSNGNSTGPSVTATGLDAGNLKVTNVQSGAIATNSKDAVNGGQVANISQSVANAIGGVQVNQDGTISSPSYNIAGSKQTSVSDALNALNQAVQNANTSGKDIDVSKVTVSDQSGNRSVTDATGTIVKDGSGNSAKTNAMGLSVRDSSGNNAIYSATNTTYRAADNSSTSIGTNGLSFSDTSGHKVGPSVTASGIDAGGKSITGVAAGVNSTDAVNKGQLDSAVNSVNNTVNTLSTAAVQYDKNTDGSVNKGRVTLGDGTNATTLTNVADGQVVAGSKDAVNGGQLANVQSQVNENTSSINHLNSTVSDLATGKSGAIQQADKNSDISIGKDTGGTKVNMANSTGGTRTVTGVSAGNIASSSTDAVNGDQLYQSNAALATALGGNAKLQSNGTVSTSNIGGTGQNTIDGAVSNLNGRVGNLESAFAQTNQQLSKLRNETNAGIAGAMAVGNLPQPSEAGMSMVSAGIGGYRGEGAVSVGVSAITDTNKYIWKFGASADTRSNVSGAVSVGYQWK